MDYVEPKVGEVYFVPAKTVHAIGKGCLILEIQEPTDFTIQPEHFCGEYELSDEEIIRQVEEDRKALSEIVGYNVEGMAYPCGGVNNDDRVAEIIKNNTGVRFSRTITSTYNFDLQDNLYRFNPTVYHREKDAMERLAEEFLRLEPTEPKIFYIWGHSYEFDINNEWAWFEDFCKEISGRKDIFYGTNSQVLLK